MPKPSGILEKFRVRDEVAYKRLVLRIRQEHQQNIRMLEMARNEHTNAVVETAQFIIEVARDAKAL